MFSDHVVALQQRVAERRIALRQRQLDQRRWAVRRDILRGVVENSNRVLVDLERAIAGAYQERFFSVVLKTYTVEEIEAREPVHQSSIGEVLTGTDVLERVGNCLAPGHFRCHLRRERRRGLPDLFHVEAIFVSEGFEPHKPPCTCVIRDMTDGFCEVCGGHEVRATED